MIVPAVLSKSDKVAIVSPSGPIAEEYILQAKKILEDWGLEVLIGKNVCNKQGVFAGTDEERILDFQWALNNTEVKAIFCSRGGYGAIRIAPYLDFTNRLQNPPWIIGFSDITVLHALAHSYSIASLHAAMPKNFLQVTPETLQSLRNAVFGSSKPIEYAQGHIYRTGSVTAPLIGGNLSVLFAMRGVGFEYNYKGKILCIEDLNEYVYHIDRIMQNLKHSGILKDIAGLVVGSFSGMKQGIDSYTGNAEDVIFEAVKEYSYPVCFNFPTGHESQNIALMFGCTYSLNVSEKGVFMSV